MECKAPQLRMEHKATLSRKRRDTQNRVLCHGLSPCHVRIQHLGHPMQNRTEAPCHKTGRRDCRILYPRLSLDPYHEGQYRQIPACLTPPSLLRKSLHLSTIFRNASAAGESGKDSTNGVPESLLSTILGSIGTRPRKGTPISRAASSPPPILKRFIFSPQ